MPQSPALTDPLNDPLDPVIQALRHPGWGIFPDFFAPDLMAELREEIWDLAERDRLRPAGIGKEAKRLESVRGDHIRWLDGATPAQRRFLEGLETLRLRVNRELLLGLEDLECHFAHYPPGAGYERHLDSFDNNNLRRLTVVAYLNAEWDSQAGGEIRIFEGEQEVAAALPLNGTLVCFISEEVPHEVAATRRHRASIAGWFRVRPRSGEANALGGQTLAK